MHRTPVTVCRLYEVIYCRSSIRDACRRHASGRRSNFRFHSLNADVSHSTWVIVSYTVPPEFRAHWRRLEARSAVFLVDNDSIQVAYLGLLLLLPARHGQF